SAGRAMQLGARPVPRLGIDGTAPAPDVDPDVHPVKALPAGELLGAAAVEVDRIGVAANAGATLRAGVTLHLVLADAQVLPVHDEVAASVHAATSRGRALGNPDLRSRRRAGRGGLGRRRGPLPR